MIVRAEGETEKQTLLEYLSLRLAASKDSLVGSMPFEVLAVVRNGVGIGAVLLTNFRGGSVELAWAGDRGWLARGELRALSRHLFDDLGVRRVWGMIDTRNIPSLVLARRLGARVVGILEDEYGPGADAAMLSMTRKQCRWL